MEEAGFSRAQAEIQLQVISEIVEGELATKQDLNILKKDLEKVVYDLENTIQNNTKDLRHEMKQIEYRLTIKLGAFLTICFTTMITLMKLWLTH